MLVDHIQIIRKDLGGYPKVERSLSVKHIKGGHLPGPSEPQDSISVVKASQNTWSVFVQFSQAEKYCMALHAENLTLLKYPLRFLTTSTLEDRLKVFFQISYE